MKDVTPIIVCLRLGSLIFLSGCSTRVWRGEGPGYRIGAIVFGLICIVMGVLAPRVHRDSGINPPNKRLSGSKSAFLFIDNSPLTELSPTNAKNGVMLLRRMI